MAVHAASDLHRSSADRTAGLALVLVETGIADLALALEEVGTGLVVLHRHTSQVRCIDCPVDRTFAVGVGPGLDLVVEVGIGLLELRRRMHRVRCTGFLAVRTFAAVAVGHIGLVRRIDPVLGSGLPAAVAADHIAAKAAGHIDSEHHTDRAIGWAPRAVVAVAHIESEHHIDPVPGCVLRVAAVVHTAVGQGDGRLRSEEHNHQEYCCASCSVGTMLVAHCQYRCQSAHHESSHIDSRSC